jgi:hypothetical protein
VSYILQAELGPLASNYTVSIARAIEVNGLGMIKNTELIFSISFIDQRILTGDGQYLQKAIDLGRGLGYKFVGGAGHAEMNTLGDIVGRGGSWFAGTITSGWKACPACRAALNNYSRLTFRIFGVAPCII